MKRLIGLVLLQLILIVAGSVTIYADDGCVTEKCHANMGTKEFVHGPVGARICTVCHNKVEGKKHQFQYSATKDELCFACHEQSRDMMLEDHVHTPVFEGNCIGCHDPHQTDYRFSLKGKAADLCMNCHDKKLFTKEFVHGPVGVGDCNACHNPHSSPNEFQLSASSQDICFECHKEKSGMLQERHVHAPVAEACTNCHNPHSNDAKFLLSGASPDLCYRCHEAYSAQVNSSHQHEPAKAGKCNACHDAHSSPEPKMFKVAATELCFSCHTDLKEFVSSQEHKHGPVNQGDCSACHNAHGSENFRLLRKYFPSEFYMPYETENYSMCFECHNKDIALDETTMTLTDFRDGNQNLHFLHVNKDIKGRSCKACHQAHASDQDKHIRESVPFGSMNWELPVTYTKYADGGNCVVGCHAPKEYHRGDTN